MNLFQGDLLTRWLVLAVGWLLAVLLGQSFWRRVPLPAAAFGAAALACVINLPAAGGIGMPAVALVLWLLIALGLNLRDDRPCSRLREYAGRLPAVGLAIVWSALAGSFFGAITPFWRSEAALAAAEDALAHHPPGLRAAQAAYEFAKEADRTAPSLAGRCLSPAPDLGVTRAPSPKTCAGERSGAALEGGHHAAAQSRCLDAAQRAGLGHA